MSDECKAGAGLAAASGYRAKPTNAVSTMLDKLTWEVVAQPDTNPDGIPFVTHEGILDLCGLKIRVVQLNTGERIFPEEEIAKLFGVLGECQNCLATPCMCASVPAIKEMTEQERAVFKPGDYDAD